MSHIVRQWGGEMPTHLLPLPFPCTLLLGVLTATDKSVTLVSQFSSSSGEWVWWGFKQWRNFACFLYVPPLFFQSYSFYLREERCYVLLLCCFCKCGVSEESPLCTGLYCVLCQKGEGHFFIWHLFPTCSIGWEMHLKNKRPLWPPFCLFFFKGTVSIWELYFWGLVTFCCIQGTIHQHCNNAACSLPQNRATNKLICVIHTVCIIKAYRQECLSLALFVLAV